jgi:hypothetical protein
MRRLISWVIATAVAFVILAGAGAAMVPTVHHLVSAWWNDPEAMSALPDSPRVHYEEGAIDYARAVAALLPAAIARIEDMQGRRFAQPVTIGVYASPTAYAATNATGSPGAVGLMYLGKVRLSPGLYFRQRHRLPAILTHELSHAHLRGWIADAAYVRLPNWFKEGLAVAVSDGGGGEGVSEMQAMAAIQSGDHITVDNAGSFLNLSQLTFVQEKPPTSFRIQMAYRQAGVFVSYLRASNPEGFSRMMAAILDRRSFVDAVTAGYQADINQLWSQFVQTGTGPKLP